MSTANSSSNNEYYSLMANSTEKQLFSKRLIELCEEKKLKERGRQAALKRVCGISQQSVSKWFNAESIPEYEHCLKLCDYFAVNYEWLLTGKGVKYRKDSNDDEKFMKQHFGRSKEEITMAESDRVMEFLKLSMEQQVRLIQSAKEEQTGRGKEKGKGPDDT